MKEITETGQRTERWKEIEHNSEQIDWEWWEERLFSGFSTLQITEKGALNKTIILFYFLTLMAIVARDTGDIMEAMPHV